MTCTAISRTFRSENRSIVGTHLTLWTSQSAFCILGYPFLHVCVRVLAMLDRIGVVVVATFPVFCQLTISFVLKSFCLARPVIGICALEQSAF